MLGKKTEEFCERWCAILNKCAFDLMTLLVDQLKKDLEELDKSIDEKKRLYLKQSEMRMNSMIF